MSLSRFHPAAYAKDIKVFWFFLSKKNCFLASRNGYCLVCIMQGWDLIRAFLALHRAGTFEGAAKSLAVDHSTLRRRIQTLEQNMGVPLFARNEGRYLVLPAMRPLLDSALSMEASSRLFFEGADGGLSGTVRVTMIDCVRKLARARSRAFPQAASGYHA